ncbi:ABC transporter permease [Actinocorallia lasiicapitis]
MSTTLRPPTATVTVREYAREYASRVADGELGTLPAAIGLVGFGAIFTLISPGFLSAANLANLITQGAGIGVMAMGLVFVLLLGEIDLSVACAGGLCGVVLALSLTWLPAYAALPFALLTGTAIGLSLGLLISRTRIPPVIATLAALLGLQGLTLVLLNNGQAIAIKDPQILAIINTNLAPVTSWLTWALGLTAYALLEIQRKHRGSHHRPIVEPVGLAVWRIVLAGGISAAIVYALTLERSPDPATVSLRGVPLVVPIVAALIVGWSYVLRRTAFGRRLTAAGAAAFHDRADIEGLRVAAYAICSTLAALGGIIAVSRFQSAGSETGSVAVLLSAVAAAIIGGASLSGGRGRVQGAVLGACVVIVVDNGLARVTDQAGIRHMVLCLFVLVAAIIDISAQRAARPR